MSKVSYVKRGNQYQKMLYYRPSILVNSSKLTFDIKLPQYSKLYIKGVQIQPEEFDSNIKEVVSRLNKISLEPGRYLSSKRYVKKVMNFKGNNISLILEKGGDDIDYTFSHYTFINDETIKSEFDYFLNKFLRKLNERLKED